VVRQPVSIKFDDLDVICAVLGCQIGDVLTPEPEKVRQPGVEQAALGALISRAT
jgi:Cro/C1-type HTH DNA-binding domain